MKVKKKQNWVTMKYCLSTDLSRGRLRVLNGFNLKIKMLKLHKVSIQLKKLRKEQQETF